MVRAPASADAAGKAAAVLPIGSFEQHGPHLPLATDTLIACEIARRCAEAHDLLLLPPITFSCSHEHAAFPGTISLGATTLVRVIDEICADLQRQGIAKVVIVNAHGGNNVLVNFAQEANRDRRRVLLYPTSAHWTDARQAAGCATSNHQDMHGGELETSILLSIDADLVRAGWETADHEADDRSLLTLLGMAEYTASGVIGRPSLATPDKGTALLESIVTGLSDPLKRLLED